MSCLATAGRYTTRTAHGRPAARMAGRAHQGRCEPGNGSQVPHVPFQRAASRSRERSNPRQPTVAGAPPKTSHRDAVQPLAPATVEAIRRTLLDPPPREVAAAHPGQRYRRRYELPAPGTHPADQAARRADCLAARLRWPAPGRAARAALGRRPRAHAPRAACRQPGRVDQGYEERATPHRPAALVSRAGAGRVSACCRASAEALLLLDDDGRPWDKTAWQMWRVDRWAPRAAPLA